MPRGALSLRTVLLGGGTVLIFLSTGCGSGSEEPVTVRVDYDHDEFATQFIRFFPDRVQVHPGGTVVFKQDWTGEAHTVTFGTEVNEALSVTMPLIEQWGDVPEDEIPPGVLEAYLAAECSLLVMYGCEEQPAEEQPTSEQPPASEATAEEETDEINQTIAQPCLIEEGPIPDDGLPCPNQQLGPFDGTEAYYNSGFLGFEAETANVFELQLSDSIQPGEYNFFCSVHGSFQSGTMEVVASDQPILSTDEVNIQTRQQLNEMVEPFRAVYERAKKGNFVYAGESYTGNFSGLVDEGVEGMLNEFIPKTLAVKVGAPVTWLMFGYHSISFDVPEYFPIYERGEDGTVRANKGVYLAAGGAPEVPESVSTEPIVVDGGTYDGSAFWSSGVLGSEAYVEYTLRFATPGTYRVACLIHPRMVGTVVVTG